MDKGGAEQISRAPRRAGRLALQPLTLLLQGQLALGLNVLQRGCQVARKAACTILGEQSTLWREMEHWDLRLRRPHPQDIQGWLWRLPSSQSRLPSSLHHPTTTTLLHKQPIRCPQTFGEGLRPKVATLSWEEEEEEPEEEGRGPLRVRGRGLVASPSILER